MNIFTTALNGKGKPRPHRPYRSCRRRYRGRKCAAATRAFTGAQLYLDKKVPTLAAAATGCGSNIHYIQAAIVLIEANDTKLIRRVLLGDITLLKAAEEVRRVVGLRKAYRTATAEDLVAFARIIGPATIFDNMVVPAI